MEVHGVMQNSITAQMNPRLSITVAEAARTTGFSQNYLRLLMSRKDLPCVRVGRAVRVLVTDLEKFLRSHRHGAEPDGVAQLEARKP